MAQTGASTRASTAETKGHGASGAHEYLKNREPIFLVGLIRVCGLGFGVWGLGFRVRVLLQNP